MTSNGKRLNRIIRFRNRDLGMPVCGTIYILCVIRYIIPDLIVKGSF